MTRRTLLRIVGGGAVAAATTYYGYDWIDADTQGRSDLDFVGEEAPESIQTSGFGGDATPETPKAILSNAPPQSVSARGWNQVIVAQDKKTGWRVHLSLMALEGEQGVRPILTVPQSKVYFDTIGHQATILGLNGPQVVGLRIEDLARSLLTSGETHILLPPLQVASSSSTSATARPLFLTWTDGYQPDNSRSLSLTVQSARPKGWGAFDNVVVSASVVVPPYVGNLQGLIGGAPVVLYGKKLGQMAGTMGFANPYYWDPTADGTVSPTPLVHTRPTPVTLIGSKGEVLATPSWSIFLPGNLGIDVRETSAPPVATPPQHATLVNTPGS